MYIALLYGSMSTHSWDALHLCAKQWLYIRFVVDLQKKKIVYTFFLLLSLLMLFWRFHCESYKTQILLFRFCVDFILIISSRLFKKKKTKTNLWNISEHFLFWWENDDNCFIQAQLKIAYWPVWILVISSHFRKTNHLNYQYFIFNQWKKTHTFFFSFNYKIHQFLWWKKNRTSFRSHTRVCQQTDSVPKISMSHAVCVRHLVYFPCDMQPILNTATHHNMQSWRINKKC